MRRCQYWAQPFGFGACGVCSALSAMQMPHTRGAGDAQRRHEMACFGPTYSVETGHSLPIEELLSLIREPEVGAATKSP